MVLRIRSQSKIHSVPKSNTGIQIQYPEKGLRFSMIVTLKTKFQSTYQDWVKSDLVFNFKIGHKILVRMLLKIGFYRWSIRSKKFYNSTILKIRRWEKFYNLEKKILRVLRIVVTWFSQYSCLKIQLAHFFKLHFLTGACNQLDLYKIL